MIPALVHRPYVSNIFLFVFLLKGDWILILVHFLKQFGYLGNQSNETIFNSTHSTTNTLNEMKINEQGTLLYFLGTSVLGSYTIYFGIGGFLHVIFVYVLVK